MSVKRTFARFLGGASEDEIGPLYLLFLSALVISALLFVILLIIRPNNAGEWGDFFGGMLNPILTFLTFLGLLITIVLQQKELKETRKELERSADALQNQHDAINRQIFENTFFQLLSLLNNITNSIDKSDGKDKVFGRDAFTVFYEYLKIQYSYYLRRNPNWGSMQLIVALYDDFWQENRNDLGHYFRLLYNILKMLDESPLNRDIYIKLVRAQLSDHELVVIFYNTLSDRGRNLKIIAEKYSLFDNLDPSLLLHASHQELIDISAFAP